MATKYWRSAVNQQWTSAASWSLSSGGPANTSIPTSADDVIFDRVGTYTVNSTAGGQTCRNMTVSAGTPFFNGGTSPTISIAGGSLNIASSTATFELGSGRIVINFTGTGADRICNTNGTTCPSINFNGASSTYRITSALTVDPAGFLTLTQGTLNVESTLTAGSFSCTGTLARTLNLNGNNIYLTKATAGTAINMADLTSFTLANQNLGGGFITNGDVAKTFSYGSTGPSNTAANVVDLTITGSGTAAFTFTANSAFKSVDFGTYAGTIAASSSLRLFSGITLSSAGTYTTLSLLSQVTCSINGNGKTIGTLTTSVASTTTTLTGNLTVTQLTMGIASATLAVNGFNFTNLASTHTWTLGSITNTGTGSVTFQTLIYNNPAALSLPLSPNSTLTCVTSLTHQQGALSLTANVALGNTCSYDFQGGSFAFNNFTLTTGRFNSAGSGTRSMAWGTGSMVLNHATAGTTVLNTGGTLYTYTGTQTFYSDAAVTRTFSTSSGSAPNLTFTGSGTAIQTILTGSYYNSLNFGTTSFALAGGTIVIVSSITLSATSTYPVLTISATPVSGGTATIDTKGLTISGFSVNAPSATVNLASNLVCPNTYAMALTAGTLNLNGYNITTGTYTSSNSNTRAINFGSGKIFVTFPTANTMCVNITTATGFTCTQTTGGFSAEADITRSYQVGNTAGGSVAGAPSLALTGSGTAVQSFLTTSWFGTLDLGTTGFTATSSQLNLTSLILSPYGAFNSLIPTMVGTGVINYNGVAPRGFTINCPGGTTTLLNVPASGLTTPTNTLTAGTLDLSTAGNSLSCAVFTSSNANTRAINFGANSISLLYGTAATAVLVMDNATNFSCTGTGGFVTTAAVTRTLGFGSTGGSATNAPNLTLTGSGTAVLTLTTGSWFNNLNFGTTVFTLPATSLNISSLILSSTSTYTALTASMTGNGVLTTNGNTTLTNITINNADHLAIGTKKTTLTGNTTLTATGTVTLTSGTLDLNGFTLTTGIFTTNVPSNYKAILFGNSNIVLAHTTAGTTVLNVNLNGKAQYENTGTGGFTASAAITRTYTMSFATYGNYPYNAPKLTLTGSGTAVQTFTTGSAYKLLDFGTTSFAVPTTTLHVDNIIFSSGGTFTGLSVVYAALTGASPFTTNGKTLAALTVTNAGFTSSLTLGSALTVTGNLAVDGGTLNTGGFAITASKFTSAQIPSVYQVNLPAEQQPVSPRVVNFNGANISLTGAGSGTSAVIYADDSNGLTFTGTGKFISTYVGTGTTDYDLGSTAWNDTIYAPDIDILNTTANTINFLGRFRDINFGASRGSYPAAVGIQTAGVRNLTLTSYTGVIDISPAEFITWGVGTLLNPGNVYWPRMQIGDSIDLGTVTTLGQAWTNNANSVSGLKLNYGQLVLNGFDLTCDAFVSNNSYPRSISFGTNKIITNSTKLLNSKNTQVYAANAENFTCTGTGGFECLASTGFFVFGSTTAPTTAPNAFNVRAFENYSYINKLEYTSTSGSFSTLLGGVIYPFYVDTLILSNAPLAYAFAGIAPIFTRTQTWTAQYSKELGGIGVNIPGGTLTLNAQTYYNNGSTLYVLEGTVDLNSTTQTFSTVSSTSASGTARAIAGPGTIVVQLATWTVTSGTGFTGSNYTINMTRATAKTFAGGGGSYGTLVQAGAGALTVSGSNTFADMQATTRPSTITFTSGTTQTFTDFNVSGTAGNLVTINSTTASSQGTLSKSSGTVNSSYLSIQDSLATGGATWNLINSTIVSNVAGWVTVVANNAVASRFMAFF